MPDTTNTKTLGINLEPLDVLFFRDGRPLEAATRVSSGLPGPQTAAGAMRTFLLKEAGCDFNKLGNDIKGGKDGKKPLSFAEAADAQGDKVGAVARIRFSGPWLSQGGQPVFPMPAVLRQIKDDDSGALIRLAPCNGPVPGWKPPFPNMLPLWSRKKEPLASVPGFLTLEGLESFLQGKVPDRAHIVDQEKLYGHDPRTGIGVDPKSLISQEGLIYALEFLAMQKGVGFYLEVSGTPEALKPLESENPLDLPLGGEGRRVSISNGTVTWPAVKPAHNENSLLMLLTPGFFDGPIPSAILSDTIAAAVPGEVGVSGWDMAKKGPKPCRFAAMAGSIYFLNQKFNNNQNPPGKSLCNEEDAQLGWGTFVEGVWKNE